MRKVVILAIVLALVGLVGWRTLEVIKARQAQALPSGVPRVRALPVQIAPATRETITVRATYSGEVAARARVDVFARIGGIVAEIPVREGDVVRKGQVVVRLDPKELRFQVEQARASTNTQRVQVEQARVNMAIQQARLTQLLAGSPPEQIRQAEEVVRQARANLEYSRQQLKRTEELYAQGFVSGQAVDAARLDVVLQETRLRSAEEQLNLLRRGPRPEEIEVARIQVRQAEVALRQAQSQLLQVQVTLRQAESLLAESAVRASAAGIVGRRLVDPGATVTPVTVLLQIVDVDPALITIPVVERETALVRPGMAAAVSADALPGRGFQGTVASISPVLATATRTAEVRIEIPNPDRALRPGMTARVDLVLANRAGVVTIPIDAVVERDGERVVFVVEERVARSRRVETGVSDGTRVEVTRGVTAGDLVVIAGQTNLRDGAAVVLPRPGADRGPGTGGPPGGPASPRRGPGRPPGGASPTPGGQGP